MSTYINTNTTASMAALNLNTNNNSLSTDIEQLSTGLQINSAADNPAGYAIDEDMKAQISGLNQATANSNDAINMTSTAESALNQVQNLLVSMRQLAVQASNTGVNNSTDVQADQTQIASMIQSINTISADTQFGGKNLLDGSSTSAMTTTPGSASSSASSSFAVVAQGTWNSANAYNYGTNSVAAATASKDTYSLGNLSGQAPAAVTSSNINLNGAITINGNQYNITATTGNNLTAFNSAIASSGYQATVVGGNLVFTSATAGPGVEPTIDSSGLVVSGSASSISATGAVDGTNAYQWDFTAATGDGGKLTAGLTNTDTSHVTVAGTLSLNDGGSVNGTITVAPGTTLAGLQSQLNAKFGNNAITVGTSSTGALQFTDANTSATLSATGSNLTAYNQASVGSSGNFVAGAYGQMTISDGSGHTMTSGNVEYDNGQYYYSFGNGLVLSTSTAQTTTGSTTLDGLLSTTAGATTTGNDLQFQIGANGGQTATAVGISSVAASQIGTGASSYTDANGNTQQVLTGNVADVNVSTFKGAQDAIAVIDQAINQVSTMSANLGSFQTNILQSNVSALGADTTNLQAAQSTVADADMAQTIVNYTRDSILVSASTSALSYANQMPQAILKLLQ